QRVVPRARRPPSSPRAAWPAHPPHPSRSLADLPPRPHLLGPASGLRWFPSTSQSSRPRRLRPSSRSCAAPHRQLVGGQRTLGLAPPHAGRRAGRFPTLAVLRRSHVMRQIEGGIDERHVREGLGKVAEETARGGIVLLRQKSHVIAEAEEALDAHEP